MAMATKHALTPLLRPLQPPRILPYRQGKRLSTSIPRHNEAPTTTTTTTTTTPPTPSEPSSTRTEPYHVTRTPSHQLPIYLLAKRGGNLHQTRVKKIEGDIAALRRELQLALVIAEEDIKINQLTRHIIIKGWRKPEVAKFLEERRF